MTKIIFTNQRLQWLINEIKTTITRHSVSNVLYLLRLGARWRHCLLEDGAGGWRWPGNEAQWRCWWLTKFWSNRRHSCVRSWQGWSQELSCITQLVIYTVNVVSETVSLLPSPWLCLFNISSLAVEVRCQLRKSTLFTRSFVVPCQPANPLLTQSWRTTNERCIIYTKIKESKIFILNLFSAVAINRLLGV